MTQGNHGQSHDGHPGDRLTADAELVDRLRVEHCKGGLWATTCTSLAHYAVRTLHRMILDGSIGAETKRLRAPVCLTDDEWALLRDDDDQREGIVDEAVARALKLFRDDGVIKGRWDPTKGATITTYVVNGALLMLRDVVRIWRKSTNNAAVEISLADPTGKLGYNTEPDVAEIAAGEDAVRDELSRMPIVLRIAVWLKITSGRTWTEIARELGVSRRVIENLLRSYRAERNRRNEENQ